MCLNDVWQTFNLCLSVFLSLPTISQIVSESVEAAGFISSATEARLSFKTGGVIERIYVDNEFSDA